MGPLDGNFGCFYVHLAHFGHLGPVLDSYPLPVLRFEDPPLGLRGMCDLRPFAPFDGLCDSGQLPAPCASLLAIPGQKVSYLRVPRIMKKGHLG